MGKLLRTVLCLMPVGLAVIGAASTAHADEVIRLVDDTQIVGKVVHFYDDVLTVQLPTGDKLRLPVEKVRRIEFQMPKPRAELSTPRKTFDRLRAAAVRGDLEAYVDGHSAYYQMFLNQQIAIMKPDKFRDQLKKEWSSVKLEVVDAKIEGDLATLRIRRASGSGGAPAAGSDAEDGEFRFVKENSEWKMILPL